MMLRRRIAVVGLLAVGVCASMARGAQELLSMSFEDLMKIDVTSVSKTPEKRFEAPGAIYVITQEDIRRSGVTNIPEALRLAPGVEVSRINSNEWSIGVRGFGSRLARYTLVLIDGRAVYDPLFAGTYWEAQDTMLEDIDRIEVIRGPGGALWGSNAVNGVINIITKNAKDTQGSLATVGGGSEEKAFGGVRYGGNNGRNLNYRVYGKYFDRDDSFSRIGPEFDDWHMAQAGVRTDWDVAKNDTLTFQSDSYRGKAGQRTVDTTYTPPFSQTLLQDTDLSGTNLLGRWSRKAAAGSAMDLQVYYDHTDRRDPDFEEKRDTLDLDFQHSFSVGWRHKVTYGGGTRLTADDTDGIPGIKSFSPSDQTDRLYNAFLQEQAALIAEKLNLTLGSKMERNDYTGWEYQPNGRLAWTPTNRQTFWSAVSRSVRTPSRVDRNPMITFGSVPPPPIMLVARFVPNDAFKSEKLLAYEVGYRAQPASVFFAEIDGFYNQYDDIHSLNINTPFIERNPGPVKLVFPFIFENKMKGTSVGGEFNSVWNPFAWWRLEGVYSYARINLKKKDGSLDGVTQTSVEGSTPLHQALFRSSLDLPHAIEVDPTVRYVSGLPAESIPAYWTMDLHVGWHVGKHTELAVVGQNLFQPRHPESNENVNEVQRGVYGKVTERW